LASDITRRKFYVVVSKENFVTSLKYNFKYKTPYKETVLYFEANRFDIEALIEHVRNVKFHFRRKLAALNSALYEVHSRSKFGGWPLQKFHTARSLEVAVHCNYAFVVPSASRLTSTINHKVKVT
jgi:hypothetical protein